MRIGGKYNWKGQPERLKYLGKNGVWNQFEKIEAPASCGAKCLTATCT